MSKSNLSFIDEDGDEIFDAKMSSLNAAVEHAPSDGGVVLDFLWFDPDKEKLVPLWKNIKKAPLGVRKWATSLDETPVRTLGTLANDEDWIVRLRVARNTNTSRAALRSLAQEADDDQKKASPRLARSRRGSTTFLAAKCSLTFLLFFHTCVTFLPAP